MQQGKIVRMFQDKGFGFIRDEGGVEYFFHSSGCVDAYESLSIGDKVEFEMERSNKGPRAVGVERIVNED